MSTGYAITTANSSGYALVGERSTVFDVPLNGRSSPVMQVMNNWCLLHTPTHAPVGADRQWSTVFDARLNGRESLVSAGMNNGVYWMPTTGETPDPMLKAMVYWRATCAEIADPCRLCGFNSGVYCIRQPTHRYGADRQWSIVFDARLNGGHRRSAGQEQRGVYCRRQPTYRIGSEGNGLLYATCG